MNYNDEYDQHDGNWTFPGQNFYGDDYPEYDDEDDYDDEDEYEFEEDD